MYTLGQLIVHILLIIHLPDFTFCVCPIKFECQISPWFAWDNCKSTCSSEIVKRKKSVCCPEKLQNDWAVCFKHCNTSLSELVESKACGVDFCTTGKHR